MIRSFRDPGTEAVFRGHIPKGFPEDLARRAVRKLVMLDAARALKDLASPPGNHLEALKGGRAGEHSIRINDQWRLCFVWSNAGAEQVEIVDYHR